MSANDNILDFPTKQELEDKLKKLIAGSLSRDEVSTWAWAWVNQDPPEEYDDVAWETLSALMTADTPTTDRPYLYNNIDFEAWLKELQANINESMNSDG